MITKHVWRPVWANRKQLAWMAAIPIGERPCAYMSCGRRREEHERSVSGRFRP